MQCWHLSVNCLQPHIHKTVPSTNTKILWIWPLLVNGEDDNVGDDVNRRSSSSSFDTSPLEGDRAHSIYGKYECTFFDCTIFVGA